MQVEVVEMPAMRFRGLKVYLESQGDKKDELNVKHFAEFIEYHTGVDMRDNPFYHLKAKQTLGIR